MATREIELNVDLIGEERELTIAEEKAIHQFLEQQKELSKKSVSHGHSKPQKKTSATA